MNRLVSIVILIGGSVIGRAQILTADFRGTDFAKPGLHAISGNWELYWNQLLTPEEIRRGSKPESIALPGVWNRRGHPVLGYATYRALIALPAQAGDLVIYFPVINSAGRIFVNGVKVVETGTVSADRNVYRAKLASTVVAVPAHASQVEVVVQCANFTYFSGGISGTPQIGTASQLMAKLNQTQGIENFFAGSLIAMWAYQLILYFLFHRGKPYLWLSLICLGVALRALIVHGGSFLLPNVFSSVPWELWKKIEFGSVYAITAFFPLYIFHLFRSEAPRWPIKFFVGIAVLLVAAVVVTPQYIYGQLLEVSHVALLLGFIYAIFSVGRAWRKGSRDAGIIFLGVLASFPFILTEILKNSVLSPLNINFMYLVEMGVLVFLLFQVYLLANHYAASYKNLELLNQNLEKIVEERSGELVTANRVKDRLLSVVSHDIRSPLNSLRGILTIYNQGAITHDEFKTYSKKIEGDLSKTSLLVENILYWTLRQLQGAEVKFESFDLNALIQENVDLYQTIASNKKVAIKNDLTESHDVNFDRNILNLSIRNLLSNAIKFSFEGGEIIVHTRWTKSETAIQVIDYGTGMDEARVKSLQSPLSVTSAQGTNEETGTGLGLSFCREYLRAAGGELQINSAKGVGSTFTITIPAQPRSATE